MKFSWRCEHSMRVFFLLGCLTLLTACTPSNDGLALQADYLKRLATVLEADAPAPLAREALSRYRMPPRRERLLAIPDLRISLLDLLVDARHCPDLQQLISQRNSSLGKQLQASQRLGYEGQLLRAIDACLPYLQEERSASLRQSLQQIAADKRQQLPAVFFNALNGSTEFEGYLRFADQALPMDAGEDSTALDALRQLAAIGAALPEQLPPPTAQLDEYFFALYASAHGGQLITSLASLTHSLDAGSALLEQRQASRPACPLGQATERGRILQNIFIKYYAGSLQPYLAQVHQRAQPWREHLQALQQLEGMPSASRVYLQRLSGDTDSLWSAFNAATARHVQAWQKTLNSCGLAPGQSGWTGNADSADQ
jgi:hypothetical protein